MVAQIAESIDYEQLLSGGSSGQFLMLQYPSLVVGNEDGMESSGERGIDVRFRAVANHPGGIGHKSILGDGGAVCRLVFFGDDFDSGKEFLQA